MKTLGVTSTIERKHESLPRFVCIPMSKVDQWKLQGTTTVEVTLNGVNIGRLEALGRIAIAGLWIFRMKLAGKRMSSPAIA